MWEAMGSAFQEFDNDAEVRCVVMRGAGDKAFASGADISQFEKHRSDAGEALQMGLVNSVVSVAELEAAVDDLTRCLVDNGPLSLKASKLTIDEVRESGTWRAWRPSLGPVSTARTMLRDGRRSWRSATPLFAAVRMRLASIEASIGRRRQAVRVFSGHAGTASTSTRVSL